MSNSELHVMLDLETMGIEPDSAIVAIGAVKFNPWADTVGTLGDPDDTQYQHFFCTVDLSSCIDNGLHVSGSTVDWWIQQEKAAQESLFAKPRYDLLTALSQFWVWYGQASLPTWSNGASFDCVLLTSAYRKMHGFAPFKFWDHRCYRTMKALINVPFDEPSIKHHALEDAKAQAVHLQKLMNFVRRK